MAKLCAVVAVALLLPPAAAAHLRTGTVAVDYRAHIVMRPVGPVSVGVYQSDRALHVTVQPGHSLVVYGYLGEPFLRIADAGPARAASSPTAEATKLVVHGRSAVWHDVRTSRRRWSVPMSVDGRPTVLTGTTTKFAHPALWPWLLLLALILLAAVRGSPSALGIASAIAATVVAVAFMLSAYADPGTWIAGVDEIFFIGAGLGVLRWGPPAARLPGALWLGLVGLAVGLSKGQVFLHALVLSALSGTAVRLGATIAIGAGLAATVTGCLAYVRSES